MLIRKISIGVDYKQSMNFVLGQEVLDKSYVIEHIAFSDNSNIDIFIKKNGEIIKWKTFNNSLPIAIEYKIDF